MVTHFSILAWEIPWIEKPGRLQSMGLKRVGYNLATKPPSPCLWKVFLFFEVSNNFHIFTLFTNFSCSVEGYFLESSSQAYFWKQKSIVCHHEVAKVLEFQLQHHSFQRNPRADLLQNGLVGSPCSSRDSQESSPAPQIGSFSSETT